MAIMKIMHGFSHSGAGKYIFNKDHALFIESNMINYGSDINKLAREFIVNDSQNKVRKKNTVHIAYSPNPRDNTNQEEDLEFIHRWMEEMGYNNCLYTIAKHQDTDITHYHILTTSIAVNGRVVSDSNERIRNLKLCRKLEKEFGYEVVQYNPDSKKPIPQWQREKGSPQEYIEKAIEMTAACQPSFPDFIRSMQDLGIDVNANFAKDQIRLSYQFEGFAIKASSVGGSQKTLKTKYGVTYDKEQRTTIEQILGSKDQRIQSNEVRVEQAEVRHQPTADRTPERDPELTREPQERTPGDGISTDTSRDNLTPDRITRPASISSKHSQFAGYRVAGKVFELRRRFETIIGLFQSGRSQLEKQRGRAQEAERHLTETRERQRSFININGALNSIHGKLREVRRLTKRSGEVIRERVGNLRDQRLIQLKADNYRAIIIAASASMKDSHLKVYEDGERRERTDSEIVKYFETRTVNNVPLATLFEKELAKKGIEVSYEKDGKIQIKPNAGSGGSGSGSTSYDA